jgi:hypothetical protein
MDGFLKNRKPCRATFKTYVCMADVSDMTDQLFIEMIYETITLAYFLN